MDDITVINGEPVDLWYKITKSLECEVYENPELKESGNVKYWIKRVYSGRKHKTSYNNYYNLYDYEIYDKNLDKCEISEINIKCNYFRDNQENIFGVSMTFNIFDGRGIIEHKCFNNNDRSTTIIEAIRFMKEYGHLDDWKLIRLFIENTKLKEDNENLKAKLYKLEKEIKK